MFKQLIKKANLNPRKLFLLDGLGALLSAFLLGVVLVRLEPIFGIPPSTLYFLALLPCLFAIYDAYGYRQEQGKAGVLLRRIAILNLLYCCLSIGFAFYHQQTITYAGWTYILLEVMIVASLANLELVVAKQVGPERKW